MSSGPPVPVPSQKLLIDSCDVVVTMDDDGTEIPHGSILVEHGIITWIGPGSPPGAAGATSIDGRGTVALPGLVNTHHHMFQALTRARAQEQGLFGWIKQLFPIWVAIDEEWIYAAARVAMAELALSGCSTTSDHHTLFPKRFGHLSVIEQEVRAARELGVRFHYCRGSIDRGISQGGLPPDEATQEMDEILAQTEEAIRAFHDPSPGSMLRLAIAPASPFTTTDRLMLESAALARRHNIRLHTHIAETADEDDYCRQVYGRLPVELLDELGWLGSDVWLAHCVHVNERGVQRFARAGSGVAWCPSSNLRLGCGIAPARAFLDAGVRVGLGVDGSASNDAGQMLAEARMGLLVARAQGAARMDAREALRVATRGGASCLGRDDIGSLEPGKRADVALFRVDDLETVGADADPVAALVFCASRRAHTLIVDGHPIVRAGQLVTADERVIAEHGHRVARRIAR